ncbi:MAG: hypothetical protein IKW33_02990 [Clostridia bacterium]|nr:hypothetical protein [Clostridia bacterium]
MYDKVCSSCGTRLSSFYNTGMLGCPRCYENFRREILVALKDIQGKPFHVGKKPIITSTEKELLDEYRRLLKEKENAGIEKRFTDMAKISKLLEELANELRNRGVL